MPLMDHFHPPLYPRRKFEAFHAAWIGSLTDDLTRRLPAPFFAEENTHAGSWLGIDVAAFEDQSPNGSPGRDGGVATLAAPVWAPPAANFTITAASAQTFEIRIIRAEGGMTLVGAIEVISPSNKDRPDYRRAFAAKCASYLYQGVSLIIIDIVTSRRANLHNEIMSLMETGPRAALDTSIDLYAIAYRPVLREKAPDVDVWTAQLRLGASLPTLPLWLSGDLSIPVDFEAAYQDACHRRNIELT